MSEPLPEKVTILIGRLSYNGYERVEIANWLVQTALALDDHPRVENVLHNIVTGYPTPRVRNQIIATAIKVGAHFCVMVDDDMVPDVHSPGRCVGYDYLPAMPDQQNFFPGALDFMLNHPGPCVVAAPYCAGPPEERVLVSRFREIESHNPNAPTAGIKLESFTRDEAAERTGIEMVSSLPTGLMMIDMRFRERLSPPYFHYEYPNDMQTELASTEDTVFSRNLGYLGIPQYCAFQSWAAHYKGKVVGRPRRYPMGAVPAAVKEAIRNDVIRDMKNARPADASNPAAVAAMEAMDYDPPPVEPLPFIDGFQLNPDGNGRVAQVEVLEGGE